MGENADQKILIQGHSGKAFAEGNVGGIGAHEGRKYSNLATGQFLCAKRNKRRRSREGHSLLKGNKTSRPTGSLHGMGVQV